MHHPIELIELGAFFRRQLRLLRKHDPSLQLFLNLGRSRSVETEQFACYYLVKAPIANDDRIVYDHRMVLRASQNGKIGVERTLRHQRAVSCRDELGIQKMAAGMTPAFAPPTPMEGVVGLRVT